MEILYLIFVGVGIFIVVYFIGINDKANKYDLLMPRLNKLDEQTRTQAIKEKELNAEKEFLIEDAKNCIRSINTLASQKTIGFPWLAEAYADLFYLQDLKKADYLEDKDRPAYATAEKIRSDIAGKRREAERLSRIYKYQLRYYENLYPFLVDLQEAEDDQIRIADADDYGEIAHEDPVRQWLTPEEFKSLSTSARNQRALDQWNRRHKSKWEIGCAYERYIGFLYEQMGYRVDYYGINKKLEDMGRDLICVNDNEILVIQCKCWSQVKNIHESHIFQLYGSSILLQMKHSKLKVSPLFYTTTTLSPKAKECADWLKVYVKQEFPLDKYPMIKCHVSKKTGEKIYHLPFDQQYDTTVLDLDKNEFYARDVSEAEKAGFRRAWKWHEKLGTLLTY